MTAITPNAISLFKRSEQIAAEVEAEYGRSERVFTAVFCNRCGTTVNASSLEALILATADWKIGKEFGDGDYCGNCK